MALILAALLTLTSCANDRADRIEGVWLLDSVAVNGVLSDLNPGLSANNDLGVPAWFDFGQDGRFEGSGPCNQISGQYDLDGASLTTTNVYSSLVVCSEESSSLEASILDVLARADVHFSSDIRMQWQTEKTTLTFRRAP